MNKKIMIAEQWYNKNKNLYEQFAIEMENIVKKIINNKGILYQSVNSRVKGKESFLNKCKKNKYINPIEEITDVVGIRIITYTNRDVNAISSIIRSEFLIDEENSSDKAELLDIDKVGYKSIHFILQLDENRSKLSEYSLYKGIKCEIQVRTLLQHAWAEIEHDRNYKFAGVLPNEIKRRFHLVAGVLELMDNEFDKLAVDIDVYTGNTQRSVARGDLNLNIDSKSLEQYMMKRYELFPYVRPCYDGVAIPDVIVQEVLLFGYKTIQEIEDDFIKYLKLDEGREESTYMGVLRDLMIIVNCDTYFSKAYNGVWQCTDRKTVDYWKKNGVKSIEKYLEDYKIEIEETECFM